MVLYLSLILFVFALILFWQSTQQRKTAGLPGGRIIYTDTRAWGETREPLYSAEMGLVGKPDYLVEQGDQVIPVEVKSRRIGEAPLDSHIFQLAAYCYLVQQVYNKRPPYGILQYANRTFAVDYTKELEAALIDLLTEMRSDGRSKDVGRSHEAPERCRACGFRSVCDQRL